MWMKVVSELAISRNVWKIAVFVWRANFALQTFQCSPVNWRRRFASTTLFISNRFELDFKLDFPSFVDISISVWRTSSIQTLWVCMRNTIKRSMCFRRFTDSWTKEYKQTFRFAIANEWIELSLLRSCKFIMWILIAWRNVCLFARPIHTIDCFYCCRCLCVLSPIQQQQQPNIVYYLWLLNSRSYHFLLTIR